MIVKPSTSTTTIRKIGSSADEVRFVGLAWEVSSCGGLTIRSYRAVKPGSGICISNVIFGAGAVL